MYSLIFAVAVLHYSEAMLDCSTVRCALPMCGAGEKLEVPKGECCKICVPDPGCAAAICLRPVCDKGAKLEVPEGQCCPICVPRTKKCRIQGQKFSNCASACPPTCENHDLNLICITVCVQRCECPRDQVIDTRNRRCVPREKCPPRENSCNKVDCQPNAVCKIFKSTREAFCEPSCTLNNGGCKLNEICILIPLQCGVGTPCPGVIRCEDPCIKCTKNEICKLDVVRCINPPCPDQARCPERETVCALPPKTGRCRAFIPRFFYNPKSRRCESFIYGGCEGNDNNFVTMESCDKACRVPRTSPCSLILCPNGFHCEVLNGEEFCNPDCSLNNGGCLRNQTCRLEDVVCVRAPCPPARICEDRDPCAAVLCSNGFRCKVSKGLAFCDPDCSLNNGGCLRNQTCKLEDVVCMHAPCPPIRICEDRNPCALVLCSNGFQCKVSKGLAFCDPDCHLNNGGCLRNQTCRLEDVVCIRALCPPIRICEDRNPCATVLCSNGFQCKVSKGLPFCDPDCGLNNGGCLHNQTCRLEDVICVRAPCPPIRICEDRSPCALVFCSNGFRCKVSKGLAFCDPDCSLNNGGCLPNHTCRLEDVVCVRAPCPPNRICEDRNPCATVRCSLGFRCKVSKGLAFCDPDCSFSNGGCLSNQTCRLEDVICVRAPCPPARICEDRNPCATVRCANGFWCKVFEGVAFCDPDCNLNNGGCASDQLCSLKNVTCFRSPCPPIRICKDITPTTFPCPPRCSKTFCQKNQGAICSNPGPREIPGCTGSCQLTYCKACYLSPSSISPRPGYCRQCALRDYRSDTWCFRIWAWCISKAHREQFGHVRYKNYASTWALESFKKLPKYRDEDNFRCYSPPCPLRG